MNCRWMLLAAAAAGLALAAVPEAEKTLDRNIEDYVKLRKQAVAGLPPLKDKAEPEEIQAHKRAEAAAIRKARAGAKQGEILTSPVEDFLKQIIRTEMRGDAGQPARDSARTGNPAAGAKRVFVKVNATYPDSAPASNVPPSLLLRLPKLPKEVDFRFVGRTLVLRDVQAGLIIDYIPNAMPR